MPRPPRALTRYEIDALLARDVPARLGTIDANGFPHVTPLWFIWEDGAFYMTSLTDRPHLRRLERNPKAAVCVDVEEPEREDGERPNRQVRGTGEADLLPDADGFWTRVITEKYIGGPARAARSAARTADPRTVIRLRPVRLIAVASI